MKYCIQNIAIHLLFIGFYVSGPLSAQSEQTIEVKEAYKYVGETKIVCGSEDYTGKGLVGPTIPIEYRELIFNNVTFEKYAGCGVNCSIMPGVTFGEGAILGANSLAVKNLEPWTIYVGSPAKPIKKRVPSGKMLKGIKDLENKI